MNSESGVEARCGKHAETFDHAEIFGRDNFHAHRTDEHHAESNACAYAVRTAILVFYPCRDDHGQRYDGQQHHQSGDDHVHHILKCAGVTAVGKREHPITDCRNPLHDGEQINPCAEQFCLLPLYANAILFSITQSFMNTGTAKC